MAGVNDWYGNFTLTAQGVVNGDLCFYGISYPALKGLSPIYDDQGRPLEFMAIPTVSEIISCYFYPYLKWSDMQTLEVDYDEANFPLPVSEGSQKTFTLNRIIGIGANGIRDVATFPKYIASGTTIGGTYSWRNEGKLWLPPFTDIVCHDGFSEPFSINPLLVNDNNSDFKVCVRNSLNHLGLYTLYVDNYKGTSQGQLHGTTVGGNSLPVVSSAYTDYMNQNRWNLRSQRLQTIADGVTNLFTGNLMGLGQNLFEYGDSYLGQLNAQNQGYSLSVSGSDSVHDLQFFTGMSAYYHQPVEELMEQYGQFFHLYGYAQNKLMQPSITSRKYWNYIKTTDVNLRVPNCPKSHLEQLKQIFNNGVTVWHVENGGMFEKLNMDNVEI